MRKDELKKILLDDLQTDFSGLGFVVSLAEDLIVPANKESARKLVIQTLSELLSEKIICAGVLEKDGGFCAWDDSTAKIVEKIEREWRELGRDPDINEIAWFSLPRNITSTAPLVSTVHGR